MRKESLIFMSIMMIFIFIPTCISLKDGSKQEQFRFVEVGCKDSCYISSGICIERCWEGYKECYFDCENEYCENNCYINNVQCVLPCEASFGLCKENC